MASSRDPTRGIVHQFTGPLTAFEHTPHSTATPSQNLVIFIGGLYDGLLTVAYPTAIASSLPPSWSLVQPILSSSYAGWGTSSLQSDVKELSKCVKYFRRIKSGKIVLLGHSTGCQDVMEYLVGPKHEVRAPIDGGILQAPVSDREALVYSESPKTYEEGCRFAQEMIDGGRGEDIMPSSFNLLGPAPVCARRWLSLASPNHDGDDDYFSSDLIDKQLVKTFGSLPARSPVCILFSGNDEHMPKTIDKAHLIDKWIRFVKTGGGNVDEENSVVIKGATHNLNGDPEEVVSDLVKRILAFLGSLPPDSSD